MIGLMHGLPNLCIINLPMAICTKTEAQHAFWYSGKVKVICKEKRVEVKAAYVPAGLPGWRLTLFSVA